MLSTLVRIVTHDGNSKDLRFKAVEPAVRGARAADLSTMKDFFAPLGANTCHFTATGPILMFLGAQKHSSNELDRFRTKLE